MNKYAKIAKDVCKSERNVRCNTMALKIAKEIVSFVPWEKYKKDHPKTEYKSENQYLKSLGVDKNTKQEAPKIDTQEVKKDVSEQILKNIGEQPKKTFFSEEEMNLPKSISQPNVTNKEEFYEQAKEAEQHMLDWLDRGEGVDKAIGGKHYDLNDKDQKSAFKKDLTSSKGPMVITAPLKGEERATEKVEADYDGDWGKLADGVRATIAVDNFDEIDGVFDKLRESGMELAKQPKDRFAKPTPGGYRDVMMSVKYPNGHIGELQVNVKSMLVAKGEAHKLYEESRSISANAEKEGRKELTDDEFQRVEKLNAEMESIYNGAWEKSKGKSASMKTALSKKTRYFEYKDNPSKWEYKHFPVMIKKGKEVVIYDLFHFFHNAQEISEKEYNEMMQG